MEFITNGLSNFWWTLSASTVITILIPSLFLLISTIFGRNKVITSFSRGTLTALWWILSSTVLTTFLLILKSNKIFRGRTMEIILYGIVTILAWILSVTIMFPLMFILKINKSVSDQFFAFMFMRFLRACDRYFPLKPCRKKTFDLLKDHLADRDVSKPLKVLEIGVGGGENLEFYPENCHLTVLDVNANFFTFFHQNQKKYPHIKYEGTVTSFAEDMKDIKDSSLDLVVGTYILCSVISTDDVLKEVKRVLKPGGKYLFLEHVRFPRSTWEYTVQRMGAPVWKTVGDGCDAVRPSGDNIKKAGFSHLIYKELNFPQMLLIVRPHVYGIATK